MIHRLQESEIGACVAISDAQLGKGYLKADDFRKLMASPDWKVMVYSNIGHIVGFCTSVVYNDESEVHSFWRGVDIPLPACLISSIAVRYPDTGRSVASSLLFESMIERQDVVGCFIMNGWRPAGNEHANVRHLAEKQGFIDVGVVRNAFGEKHGTCPVCGPTCHCDAVLYYRNQPRSKTEALRVAIALSKPRAA